MQAAYDLLRCPPTYDVVAFLALLEAERIRRGDGDIDLSILPGPVGGFRNDTLWPRTVAERLALRENVLIPICKLLPSMATITILKTRPPASASAWGANSYMVGLPAMLEALRAGSRPLRAPYLMDAPRPYITITLREAEHHSKRNSNVDAWIVAALHIQEISGCMVVFVRDTLRATERIPAFPVEEEAAKDVLVRATLYQNAVLNMGVSNGPMWLAIFMNAPVLMLRPTTNEASGCYDDRFYARCGLPKGSQLPNSPEHQRLVWETDSKENILVAFREMRSCLPQAN